MTLNLPAPAQVLVQAWGWNSSGQLGNGTLSNSNEPLPVPRLEAIIGVSCGFSHSAVLERDGNVWTWGGNVYGQIGDGTTMNRPTAVQVLDSTGTGFLSGVTVLSSGYYHMLALKSDGTVCAWGRNNAGQLGDGTNGTGANTEGANRSKPIFVQVNGGSGLLNNVTAIAGGGSHSLALRSDGTVWAWGSNGRGQLGINSTDQLRNRAVQVPGLSNIVAVAAGETHSLALRNDGTVWAWGQNTSGQLGDSTTTRRSFPVQVVRVGYNATTNPGFLTQVASIACGGLHSLAILTDGTAVAWGSNSFGQLGNGTTQGTGVPKPVSGLTNLVHLSGGFGHSLGVRSDGSVYTWGYNFYGQLGNQANSDQNQPVPVQAAENSGGGACGYWHTVALAPGRTVGGRIQLDGSVNLAQPLTLTFRPQIGESFVREVTLDENGNFEVEDIPRAVYTLHISGRKWLSVATPIDTRTQDVIDLSVYLWGGDVNGDNTVDIFDLILLFAAYGSSDNRGEPPPFNVPDSNWNDGADGNDDGFVDLFDLVILFNAYGLSGDE